MTGEPEVNGQGVARALAVAPRDTAADLAAQSLFDAIVDGRIPPGAPLRLQDVADQLGMSMMPVREAIRRLAALDLVEVVPHKGATVRLMSMRDLEDTYFTRLHLESLAVREAAARFSPEAAVLAQDALAARAAAISAGDRVAARNAHERFHFVIYEASDRGWLVRGILPGWRNSERYRVESLRHPGLAEMRAHEHERLLAAVTAGDAEEAVRRLVEHLSSSVRLAADALEPGRDHSDPASLHLPGVDDVLPRRG